MHGDSCCTAAIDDPTGDEDDKHGARTSAINLQAGPADSITRGIVAAMRRWIARASLDERARYLAEATSLDDLERRLKTWNEPSAADRPSCCIEGATTD
jgi:hypothetical protein